MPEIISTPHALVQTTNGKRFYVNSGLVSVDNTETSLVDIANIGERDIIFRVNPMVSADSSDDMTMKIKNNGFVIYQLLYTVQNTEYMFTPISFIIPANTSIEITFKNADATSHLVGVSCYGRYLSM